ncbi:hypothetical protein BC831DRAFT_458113 [Entophlyctis helioformis]|nr:hypothetical protein BC831DRAFT_458113 [Entophlyctis helioformis]
MDLDGQHGEQHGEQHESSSNSRRAARLSRGADTERPHVQHQHDVHVMYLSAQWHSPDAQTPEQHLLTLVCTDGNAGVWRATVTRAQMDRLHAAHDPRTFPMARFLALTRRALGSRELDGGVKQEDGHVQETCLTIEPLADTRSSVTVCGPSDGCAWRLADMSWQLRWSVFEDGLAGRVEYTLGQVELERLADLQAQLESYRFLDTLSMAHDASKTRVRGLEAKCAELLRQRDEVLTVHEEWVRRNREQADLELYKKIKDLLNAKKRKIRELHGSNLELIGLVGRYKAALVDALSRVQEEQPPARGSEPQTDDQAAVASASGDQGVPPLPVQPARPHAIQQARKMPPQSMASQPQHPVAHSADIGQPSLSATVQYPTSRALQDDDDDDDDDDVPPPLFQTGSRKRVLNRGIQRPVPLPLPPPSVDSPASLASKARRLNRSLEEQIE